MVQMLVLMRMLLMRTKWNDGLNVISMVWGVGQDRVDTDGQMAV
jgi:hypothetical protein